MHNHTQNKMSFRFSTVPDIIFNHNDEADALNDVFRHPVVTIARTRDSTPVYTYTPQDLRAAYKSTPVAPSDGKKTVVITIVMAYALPATLLQSSLDAFCKLNDIPTTTLELIPIVPIEQNELIGIFADLIMSYVNSSNGNNNFNPTTFESDYIIPCVEYLIKNVNLAQQQAEGSFLVQSFLGILDALYETLLDIQWSHAMNPNAHIRVVQSPGMNSTLFDAVKHASDPANFANNQWGPTDVISMSWGGPESAVSAVINELDTSFNNNKICYLAASGDFQKSQYPTTSANVLSVGGTSIYYDQGTMSQTTWSNAGGSGGGCGPSIYIPKPEFQTGVSALNTYNKRCCPDIAGIADPSTGVNIIFGGGSTSGNAINSMYFQLGGTSLACPANAGMLSNLIQTSINRDGPTYTTVLNNGNSILLQKALYDLYKNVNNRSLPYLFYDVTQGTDNGFSAGPGFDIPTGLGSPYWDNISATWVNAAMSDTGFSVEDLDDITSGLQSGHKCPNQQIDASNVNAPRIYQHAPYTPLGVRRAYKSSPVAPLYGKKKVVITIAIAFAFPATFLQASLDAFCQVYNIPTTTLEVIPMKVDPFFQTVSSLIMNYVNGGQHDGSVPHFNLNTFMDAYVAPWSDSWVANANPPVPSDKVTTIKAELKLMIAYSLNVLMETLLDTQWSHAMNPNAHIRVVQSSNMNTLYDAVIYASDPANFTNNPWGPTDVISMSWGANDNSFTQTVVNDIEKIFNNNKICYLAASGDHGTVIYPATSAHVLGVGGTSLYYDQVQGTMRQTTWNDVYVNDTSSGGCGPSINIPKPDFQTGVTALNAYNKRCSPDIAGIADPLTGIIIIFGSTSGNALYTMIGGTSLACPANAGMLSNLIQTSINRDGPTYTTVLNNGNSILLQKALYDLYKNVNNRSLPVNPDPYAYSFYNVTEGTANGFSAGPGFNIPTGLGSPYWDNISATWFYATPSEICFPANTPVLTDQGIVAIQNIEPGKHTLRNKRIVAVTQTVSQDDYLVHFSKHSLGHNYPTEDTRMSKHHKILYSGKMISARHFLTGFKNVTKVAYNKEFLYNVLLDEHSSMQINNLTCETLHPRSAVAKLHNSNNSNNSNNNNSNNNHATMTASEAAARKFRNLFVKADARQYGCNNVNKMRK